MKSPPRFTARFGVVTGICVALCASAGAQIFSEDFEIIPGNLNGGPGGQHITSHDLVVGASLTGWANAGAGTIHAVDSANTWTGGSLSANPQNWGVMIWQDNVITQTAGIPGSNDNRIPYDVDFLAAGGVYHAASQVNNGATDNLKIEVLRASDSAVLHSFNHSPAPPLGVGDLGLLPVNFGYTGDGSGDILFRIGPGNANQGRFQGTVDDLVLSIADPNAPSIASFTATPDVLADPGEAVTFEWTVGGLPLDSLVITPGDIDVLGVTDGGGSGSHPLDPGPDGTTEYTLTATKGGASASRMVTVTLPAPEITSFTAAPSPLAPGADLTLSWQVGLPAATLTITPGDIDVLGDTDGTGAGSIIVNPTESTIYTLTATRGTSTSTANASAIVQTPPNPNAIAFYTFDEIIGGGFNGGQFESGLDLAFGADLPGWSKSGGNPVHVVDTANLTGNIVNPRNFAVMIWQDNVITQDTAIPASNEAGTEYLVEFDASPAVYQAGTQQTSATDGLLIELLNPSDVVVASYTHLPGAWGGNTILFPDSFTYIGDGSGDLRFRVGPSAFGSGRFGGGIDNLALSPAITPRVRVTDISHNSSTGQFSISWESAEGKLYNLLSVIDPSSDLPIDWPIFGGNADLAATPPENTLTIPLPADPERFFVIEEFNAPPESKLADNFESGQGQWTTGSDGAGGTIWELGTPTNAGPAAANSPANCFGTNLAGSYAIDAEVWLRSPPIDLTTAGGATLNYAQFYDIEAGFDSGRVRVLDNADNSELAVLEDLLDGASSDWEQVAKVLPAAALGKTVLIEFRLITDDFDDPALGPFAGWYIDDFDLTVP